MTRTVNGVVSLIPVDVTTLPATVDHYHMTGTSVEGGTTSADAPVDATSISVVVAAGTWTFMIEAVDAAGNVLGSPVTGSPSPLVVTDVTQVFVNVPSALALTVA